MAFWVLTSSVELAAVTGLNLLSETRGKLLSANMLHYHGKHILTNTAGQTKDVERPDSGSTLKM